MCANIVRQNSLTNELLFVRLCFDEGCSPKAICGGFVMRLLPWQQWSIENYRIFKAFFLRITVVWRCLFTNISWKSPRTWQSLIASFEKFSLQNWFFVSSPNHNPSRSAVIAYINGSGKEYGTHCKENKALLLNIFVPSNDAVVWSCGDMDSWQGVWLGLTGRPCWYICLLPGPTHLAYKLYCKCNLPMTVNSCSCWSVGRSVKVFENSGKLHFHAPSRALFYSYVLPFIFIDARRRRFACCLHLYV